MSENITPITEQQAETITAQNKAKFAKDNLNIDYSNSAIKACDATCRADNDTSSNKRALVTAMADIHNGMVDEYKAFSKDTTITPDNILLLQDTLVDTSSKKFESLISQAKSDLHTEKNRLEKELFTANAKIDDITLGMLPMLSGDLISNYLEFINIPVMADAINILNLRGLYPTNGKRGEPNPKVSDALNDRYSNEANTRLKAIQDDFKMIGDIEKQESNIVRKMKPPAAKIQKIKANKVMR